MPLNKEQLAIIRRVRRAMDDAKKAGLATFCDAESWAIRFVPEEDIVRDDDPRGLGEVVKCNAEYVTAPPEAGERVYCSSACGTPVNNCPNM